MCHKLTLRVELVPSGSVCFIALSLNLGERRLAHFFAAKRSARSRLRADLTIPKASRASLPNVFVTLQRRRDDH